MLNIIIRKNTKKCDKSRALTLALLSSPMLLKRSLKAQACHDAVTHRDGDHVCYKRRRDTPCNESVHRDVPLSNFICHTDGGNVREPRCW